MRVLVADDRSALRSTLSYLLEDWGYQVETASNGKEALEKSKTSQYDLCLMDIRMPEMDGLEAARCFRLRSPYTPILALTSEPVWKSREFLNSGMDDYLEKPFNIEDLRQKIVELTVKSATITKNDDGFIFSKELPMDQDHLKELKELNKKGLVKLAIKGSGAEFVVHPNVQNKISYNFIEEGKELSIFMDRSEDKPGVCHLYKANLYANVRYVLPEECEQLIKEEDEGMQKYRKPVEKKSE